MDSTANKVNHTVSKLKRVVESSLKNGDIGKSMAAINSCAGILYNWNQSYKDDELEEEVFSISKSIIHPELSKKDVQNKNILFYDSFGADQRGLQLIYLKALCELGYHVIYVTKYSAKDKQPVLMKVLNGFDVEFYYYSSKSYLDRALEITDCLERSRPSVAFLHLSPSDVSAITVFSAYEGIVNRFLINLTDHAFWLGINTFDYIIEFRSYGAIISNRFRGIDKDKILLLPYYPFINIKQPFLGFDEAINGKKVFFSGGSIYKTLGDSESRFYRIVDEILANNEDVVFIYATNEEVHNCEFFQLRKKYSQRVHIIKERIDLYQVMSHSVLYLNTFPKYGGLMTQYAIAAGKVPLTLLRESSNLDGIVLNAEKYDFTFNDYHQLVEEANRLIKDVTYREQKENSLKGAVISEDTFRFSLQEIILRHQSKWEINYSGLIDVDIIREEYRKTFNYNEIVRLLITNNKQLFRDFPFLFLKTIYQISINKVKSIFRMRCK